MKNHKQNNLFAKEQALLAMNNIKIEPAAIVPFQSKGVLLIVGRSVEEMQNVAKQLSNNFVVHYLNIDIDTKIQQDIANLTTATIAEVKGHLGAFEIDIIVNNKLQKLTTQQQQKFDVIIDLSIKPKQVLSTKLTKVMPFGYYPIKTEILSQNLVEEINTLIGVLDKPKFFNLESDICIHNRNKTTLCERCINSCPAQAIYSDGESIDVDSYLCHGFGSCASACPTGAISYAYPNAQDNYKKVHTLINQYSQHQGKHPALIFYTQDKIKNIDELDLLGSNVLPFPLEEVGVFSLDFLLYTFCLGVEQTFVLCNDEPLAVEQQVSKDIYLMHQILNSLGYQTQQAYTQLIKNLSIQTSDNTSILQNFIGIIDIHNKRERFFAIVDFLYQHKQTKECLRQCDFNANDDVFFGSVEIDNKSCTLCMACASVCPSHAIFVDNPDKPTIYFQEELCVQCTLCAQSCPEDSIQLNPRLLYDKVQRQKQQILNQDEPFRCVTCQKIFASKQVIEKMTEQLQGHAMFSGEKLMHLQMCEDCRVKALFEDTNLI